MYQPPASSRFTYLTVLFVATLLQVRNPNGAGEAPKQFTFDQVR
jgi:hypothetical protein